MKKFLNSDWLRAVQFFRNAVPKNEIKIETVTYDELVCLRNYL